MTAQQNISTDWNPTTKIIFRFYFCYLILYLFPFPLDYIPFGGGGYISNWVNDFWYWLVPLVSENIFLIKEDIPIRVTGSGDTFFHFLQTVVHICLALISMLVWSIFDGNQKKYKKLFQYSIIGLRYFLAFTILTYGLSKVFVNQFWELNLSDLLKPYGDSSPMGLLWKFMGYSKTYSMFTGFMEVVAGIFLLFRQTTRLGALLCFGIMVNVFVLNISYDVPVKLFSAHLVLMSVFILGPDLQNLMRFLLLNKATAPISIKPYFRKKEWNIGRYIFKGAVLVYIIFTFTQRQIENQKKFGKKAELPTLYGIYDVEYFILNQDTLTPLTSDMRRWKRLVVDKWNNQIIKMNGDKQFVKLQEDSVENRIKFISLRDTTLSYDFEYLRTGSTLNLLGRQQEETLKIQLRQIKRSDFYLIKRGFHWINEYPANR